VYVFADFMPTVCICTGGIYINKKKVKCAEIHAETGLAIRINYLQGN
jgi:hypothetical protein